jgi:hypothetical protein
MCETPALSLTQVPSQKQQILQKEFTPKATRDVEAGEQVPNRLLKDWAWSFLWAEM